MAGLTRSFARFSSLAVLLLIFQIAASLVFAEADSFSHNGQIRDDPARLNSPQEAPLSESGGLSTAYIYVLLIFGIGLILCLKDRFGVPEVNTYHGDGWRDRGAGWFGSSGWGNGTGKGGGGSSGSW